MLDNYPLEKQLEETEAEKSLLAEQNEGLRNKLKTIRKTESELKKKVLKLEKELRLQKTYTEQIEKAYATLREMKEDEDG